jgi:hypothetical protein
MIKIMRMLLLLLLLLVVDDEDGGRRRRRTQSQTECEDGNEMFFGRRNVEWERRKTKT